MKRIGLFCGCFDPIHNGHIRAAENFLDKACLECVYLVPANASYCRRMESGKHRLEMCRLAAKGHAGIQVCDFEICLPQTPYTADTVAFFAGQFPGAEICLCMGEDTAETVPYWACFQILKECVRFLVVSRYDRYPGAKRLQQSGADVLYLRCEKDGISSTAIRKKLISGEENIPELNENVFCYIRENALYGRHTEQEGEKVYETDAHQNP